MHLLVVEDDDIVRMLMVEVLDELGYTVIDRKTPPQRCGCSKTLRRLWR